MPKLTKSLVEKEQPGTGQKFIWDSELKGFGVKIFPTGAKTFIFQYRTPEGQSRRYTIGKWSDTLTVEQARKIARDRHLDVLSGKDPQGTKRERRAAATLAQVFDGYLESDTFREKAASTRSVDTGRINHHLRPLLGSVFADKLTTGEVKRARKAIAEGKTAATLKTKARGLARVGGGEGTAKKAVALLRAICRWASKEGISAGTGVEWSDIKMTQDGQREAIIEDADAYGRLFRALDAMQNEKRIRQAVADAIRFIALTGARRGEVSGLRWKFVDLKNGRIVYPPAAHKTGHGTGKAKVLSLPAQAQAIIASQPAGEPDDYVFRPAKGEGPLALAKPWRELRTEAGLPDDLGLHGLRHSVGSHLAMAGASLVEVMAQLGHSDPKTSLRYIHYAERARSALAERAAAVAVAGMKGEAAPAKVLPLKQANRGGK